MEIPDYREFEEIMPLEDYARGKIWAPGEYSHDTEIGEKDGQKYFIKDKETGQGLVIPYVLADTVAEEIGFDLEIKYDEEAGKIIRPEIKGAPTDEYMPGILGMFRKLAGKPLGPEPQELYEASALKYFIADTDVAPNIVVNEESAEPIDFQRAGATAKHFYNEFLDDAEEVFDHLNREFSQQDLEEVLRDYAQQADIEGLEEDLREELETHETFRTESREEAVVRKTRQNFERFR